MRPCPHCDSVKIRRGKSELGHFFATIFAARTRICADCGEQWRVRKKRRAPRQVLQELTLVGVAGAIGFLLFFGISYFMSHASSKLPSQEKSSGSMVEKVMANQLQGAGFNFGGRSKEELMKKAKAHFGKDFDPSNLSSKEKGALMKKARQYGNF